LEKEVIDRIGIDIEGEIIFTTVAKYKLFLSYGKIGMDAYLLYSHLMFTARLQHTNNVKANNVYLRQGLKMGKERLQKAKNLLTELELIKSFSRIDEETKQIKGWYIQVQTRTTPFEIKQIINECTEATDPESHPLGEPDGGFQDTNALTNNINALTNNINIAIADKWNSKEKLTTHGNKTIKRQLKKKHYDIIKEYGIETILKAIDNYYTILISKDYYYTYQFNLWKFIEKVDDFIDEANPFDKFKNKFKKQNKEDKEFDELYNKIYS